MSDNSKIEAIKYIVARLIENANDAYSESKNDPKNDYEAGRKNAYYEVLDVLQSELDAHDFDLKEFGLDINLVKRYL